MRKAAAGATKSSLFNMNRFSVKLRTHNPDNVFGTMPLELECPLSRWKYHFWFGQLIGAEGDVLSSITRPDGANH
jgi:hypothetical protein